jgi:hypothetical protein
MKQSNFIMLKLIPGPKGPGNDIDVYLEPLVDELMQLWAGVDTYDAVTKQKFSLRAALLWTMHDLPAYAYLAGYGTCGKFGCPNCAEHTSSKWLKKGAGIVTWIIVIGCQPIMPSVGRSNHFMKMLSIGLPLKFQAGHQSLLSCVEELSFWAS